MSYFARVVKVMIASPSDVGEERQLIRDVVHEWNAVHAADRKIVLMPVGWETHSTPDIGDRPQAIINKQLLKSCDLLVAAFWTRLGSPTGVAESGTVEEIEEHLAKGKPAMIYFSVAPVRMDSVDSDQYEKLRAFKENLRSRGLVNDYENLPGFREAFSRHLAQRVIADFATSDAGENHEVVLTKRPPDLTDSARELLLKALDDLEGTIIYFDSLDRTTLETNFHSFVEAGNVRSTARWRAALDELRNLHLIEDWVGMGEVFVVTDAGYQVGEFLRSSESPRRGLDELDKVKWKNLARGISYAKTGISISGVSRLVSRCLST